MTAATTPHGAAPAFAAGLVDVADGACAWLQPNGDWGESNAGLILGDDAAALVDTAWDLPRTRQLLADIRRRTDLPLRHLLLTHADGDHANGAQLLPDAELICSEAAAHELDHEDPAALHRAWLGARLLARSGIGAPRRFGAYVDWMLGPFDLRRIELRRPDRTFARDLVIDVGGRDAHLHHLGPAHTAGDAIVHVPSAGTVFTGDLLFVGVTPNSWSGDVDGWRRALDAIADLGAGHLVPGHGPPAGLAELALLDRYWAWLQEHATRLLAAGHSIDETARRLLLGDEFRSAPWGRWACPERTVCTIVSLDRTRRGLPPAISHRERPRVLWKVATLAHRLRLDGHSTDGLQRP
ncbi:MAG: MBL fold metallo-hydrolase [Patulibacter minatonensis]